MSVATSFAPSPSRIDRQSAALRQAFVAALTPDDLAAIARALRDRAVKGDPAAARLVLSYALGRPGRAAAPDAEAADRTPSPNGNRPAVARELLTADDRATWAAQLGLGGPSPDGNTPPRHDPPAVVNGPHRRPERRSDG